MPFSSRCRDVTWPPWRAKSPAIQLVIQRFPYTNIKETSKLRHWSFVRGIHRYPVDSPHKGPETRRTFPFHDVIISLTHSSQIPATLTFSWLAPLQWRHNEHNGVSNHQPRDCLLNHLFKQIKENIKALRHLCEGNSPVTGEFPGASNAENASISWRHRVTWRKHKRTVQLSPTGHCFTILICEVELLPSISAPRCLKMVSLRTRKCWSINRSFLDFLARTRIVRMCKHGP